jgi:hypothetical protein
LIFYIKIAPTHICTHGLIHSNSYYWSRIGNEIIVDLAKGTTIPMPIDCQLRDDGVRLDSTFGGHFDSNPTLGIS